MPTLSLIVLRASGSPWPGSTSAAIRASLEEAGFSAEVLVVSDPSARPGMDLVDPWCRSIEAPGPGLARSAITGLREAQGECAVVLDPRRDYRPEDVMAAVDRLFGTDARVVVAVSEAAAGSIVGRASRRFLGSADPTSGLVALRRAAAVEADARFRPAGPRFAAEILARVAGPRADVELATVAPAPKLGRGALLDDLRLVKRLLDDRFGTASRLVQFCCVGASGMVVDLTAYAGLQAGLSRTGLSRVGLPFVDASLDLAASAVLAIGLALTWNFSINRRLTFNDARGGSIGAQYLRYALSNLVGIAVSLTLRLALPGTFGYFARHRLAAAVTGIVAATGISFAMARWFVFGKKPTAPAEARIGPQAANPGPARHVRADHSGPARHRRVIPSSRRTTSR